MKTTEATITVTVEYPHCTYYAAPYKTGWLTGSYQKEDAVTCISTVENIGGRWGNSTHSDYKESRTIEKCTGWGTDGLDEDGVREVLAERAELYLACKALEEED